MRIWHALTLPRCPEPRPATTAAVTASTMVADSKHFHFIERSKEQVSGIGRAHQCMAEDWLWWKLNTLNTLGDNAIAKCSQSPRYRTAVSAQKSFSLLVLVLDIFAENANVRNGKIIRFNTQDQWRNPYQTSNDLHRSARASGRLCKPRNMYSIFLIKQMCRFIITFLVCACVFFFIFFWFSRMYRLPKNFMRNSNRKCNKLISRA